MKFEAADLPRISLGIVGLVLMLALGVGAILAASRVDTLAVKARDEAQRDFGEIDGKLRQTRSEEVEIRSKAAVFTELQQRGVVGDEQRLEWVELIKSIRDERRLRDVRYEITPQRLLDTKQTTADSHLAFYASAMIVQLKLLHEEDLLRFLADIQTRAHALIAVRRCDLSRLPAGTGNEAPHANLQAECVIDWITLRDKRDSHVEGGSP